MMKSTSLINLGNIKLTSLHYPLRYDSYLFSMRLIQSNLIDKEILNKKHFSQ
jgi:hypothetical protein